MFIGVKENQLDAKNRCIVPAKFRSALGSDCVLVRDPDGYLVLFPRDEWLEYAEVIKSRPDEDEDARKNKNYFFTHSDPCEVDKQGRILLPASCIKHAGIVKNIVNVGEIDRIKIWSEENYEVMMTEIEPQGNKIRSKMNKYNIKE